MRCLLFFVVAYLSFAQASPFRFEPRISLLPRTEELSETDCFDEVALQDIGMLGQAISILAEAAPEKACFVVEQTTSKKVAHYFGTELASLGYSKEAENFQPPGLYNSKWAKAADSVLSFIWFEVEPTPEAVGTMMFAFHNDGSLTPEGAKDLVEDSMNFFR